MVNEIDSAAGSGTTRPQTFRDVAEAATQTKLAYWSIIVVAGMVATLGLALNSAAVIIGAMLIAPLLAPLVGLAMGLAVGDSRLALHTVIVVAASTVAGIGAAALVTVLLPFHTLTDEILSRTKPTTLDLGVAILSGVAAGIVTVSRSRNLAGAVPGVAVAVALVPPLSVAGFGVGIGWDWTIIRGSLLLYSANLAGIVLSAMAVFILAGMHRPLVLEAARAWHDSHPNTRIGKVLTHTPGSRHLGIAKSPWARLAVPGAFVILVGLPLTSTLRHISREARIAHAVSKAEEVFNERGRSFVLGHQIVSSDTATLVYLRVATTRTFDADTRTQFEKEATRAAGENVNVVLEQIPSTNGSVAEFSMGTPRDYAAAALAPQTMADRIVTIRTQLGALLSSLSLPDSVRIVGASIETGTEDTANARIAYMARSPLPPEAAQILSRNIRIALDSVARVSLIRVPAEPLALGSKRGIDSTMNQYVARLLAQYPRLVVRIVHNDRDSVIAARAAASLLARGVDGARMSQQRDTVASSYYKLIANDRNEAKADH